ncbi:VOC family protein [Microlunatus sp. Y2014]|uniref:VOC family protein n=1 Tax=Microlunatus sp. Y2014 TaxID=3418488 RepID=UPI003DA70D70
MRLDHLSFAVTPDGLAASAAHLGEQLGEDFNDGGIHPRFGTTNMTLPIQGGRYVELVQVLDHPAADKAPFGQAVRARSDAGGGWLAWVLAVDDMAPFEERLGRSAAPGARVLPTGEQLAWTQLGIKGLQADPQLPFFVHWESEERYHPGARLSQIALKRIVIAGDPDRVRDWIGGRIDEVIDDLEVEWVSPNGNPGLMAAVFDTPRGEVVI